MQTILITGSNGLLGQKLVHLLKSKNSEWRFNIVATSTGENRISDKNGYTYHSLDITNQKEVASIFEKVKPGIVVNTAAMTNVDACEEQKEACRKLNVDAVSYLLESCIQHQAKLIHLSTDFVFDGENGPYKETDQPNPLSFYGHSKYDSELLLLNSEYKNWCIVRTIIIYGIVKKMSRSNLVLWAKESLENGKKINVVTDQFRSPTLAEDLAMACYLMIEKNAKGIFHISGEETKSIYDLVIEVAKTYELDIKLISPISSDTLNQAAKRPPKTGFVIDKAKKELGYQPMSFKNGLLFLKKQLNS